MAIAPSIFISATSGDLHTARDLVAKILTSLGYNPVWQDIAATDAGILSDVLRSWIKPCAAVIQLVGFRYGAEPRQPDPQFGRASYTQLEAMYAERMGKKVIYIFLPPEFPADPCEPEPDEKAKLQLAYRQRLKDSGVLRHNATSPLELENRVLRIRDELAILRAEMEKSRRRLRWVSAFAIVLLIGIGLGVWHLSKSSQQHGQTLRGIEKVGEDHTKSLTDLQKSAHKGEESSARVEAKIDELRSLPASVRADRLGAALASANDEELFALRQAGITPAEVENALTRNSEGSDRKIASLFFSSSKNNPRAIEWLKLVLKDGLDPNLTIPHSYFEHRAILIHAMNAGNAKAAIALLEAGASPHPYQGLWLTSIPIPAFLFPYSYLMEIESFDADEKRSVARALQKTGAAITRYEPGVIDIKANRFTDTVSEQRKEVEKVFSAAQGLFGFKLEETPPLAQALDSPIAKAAGKQGEPWEKFLRDMPLRIISEKRPDFGPFWIEVRNFIGTYFDRGYFLGVALDYADGPEYALIEVSKDFRRWNVYMNIATRAGMGFAKDEKGVQEYGSNLPAWRRFDFTYFPDKSEMLLTDYYKYKTTRDLSEKIPR